MVMNPRTHPRGTAPDFTLPKPNPNPERVTNALWWLVCMRQQLEPLSQNGGILAIKPGYHSYGSRLPDHGLGDPRTDHSIRRAPDRTGPWWKQFAAAHDWSFTRAHLGNYTEINLYTGRLVTAMKSLTDLRPDDVYAYTIGQADTDKVVEGWNEYKDEPESGDSSHLWHRHDSFRRNIVGSFPHMWMALTIDMGWTFDQWLESTATQEDDMTPAQFLTLLEDPKVAARMKVLAGQGTHNQLLGGSDVTIGVALELVLARSAGDDLDEAEVARLVLAGLDPQAIAAAIPQNIAVQVADELRARLQA